MNAPRPEFLRGAEPGESMIIQPWIKRSRAKFVIFEADRRAGDEQNLLHCIQDWRKRHRLAPTAGYCMPVVFPSAPAVDVVVWSHQLPFPPVEQDEQLAYFLSLKEAQEWMEKKLSLLVRSQARIYGSCRTPEGEPLPGHLILRFHSG